ncbi:MAG TPA: hypothetical protein VFI78_05530, partial [Salinimicrobium sp.]|nr:hypothetical protein [Salinimicrobium sp.]
MPERIGILVQARMSSSRLPGKSLRLIGENPLIWYVVQRMRLLNLPVIVCTSVHPSDDVLCDYLKTQDIPFYRGSLENVLQRYIQAAEKFGIEHIVRVTGDNPLVDIELLEKSLHFFKN